MVASMYGMTAREVTIPAPARARVVLPKFSILLAPAYAGLASAYEKLTENYRRLDDEKWAQMSSNRHEAIARVRDLPASARCAPLPKPRGRRLRS